MVGIQPAIQFRFLFFHKRHCIRDFRNTVPDVFDQQDAFRDTEVENV